MTGDPSDLGFCLVGKPRYDELAVLSLGGPDYPARTVVDADPAAGAFVVIDGSHEIDDLDGAGGTVLLAFSATDAAYVALLPDYGALFDRHASNPVGAVVGYESDYLLRTGPYAGPAALALAVVDDRHPVDDRYGSEAAARDTGPEADAAVGTELVPSAHPDGGDAVGRAGVDIFLLSEILCARAHDLRSHADRDLGLDAHYLCDLYRRPCAAHRT